jgi:hypothetical protein
MTVSPEVDADQLAEEVLDAFVEFDSGLHGRGPFPLREFGAFFDAVVRYANATAGHVKVHRAVVRTVCGLREILELKSSCAPGRAIADADRLESILVSGHDPHFAGHEPPDC